MSQEVSPAMQEVTNQPTIQDGANALLPSIASTANALATNDGAGNVVAFALPEGEVPVGGPNGTLTSMTAPVSQWQDWVVVPSDSGGNVHLEDPQYAGIQKVILDNDAVNVYVPDGTAIKYNIKIAIPKGNANTGPVAFQSTSQQAQAFSQPSMQVGEMFELSYMKPINVWNVG